MELRLGEKQTLVIVKKVEFGVYLATKEAPEDKVLLPAKQVPEGAKVGDELEVFLYRDSSDRLISTTRTPKLCMGQVALLTVVQVGKVGAFLDWGLEKDLLLPFKQQTRKVKTGEQVLAALYIDKSGRLCATMNVYEHLRTDSPYKNDDKVTGRIYEISKNFGAFVNDKAAPEVIAHETGMSKNEFKRAVGHLLKEGKIQITEKNIRRVRG